MTMTKINDVLLATDRLTKSYAGADGELPVLAGIDLQIHAGEIVALLGRSGSGKSTLLRCLAGLIPPSAGTVSYKGDPLKGSNPGTAMVFQTFALLPWLTVQQNVELGLEARGVPETARAQAALQAIDLIGLDGFESAYPKELSGGMRQRVGFARALVVEPDVLLMDEPFSALDVLTAENLRGELLELWDSGQFPTKAIVVVTHNIEEAVILADRVLVLGSRPGIIKAEYRVDLPRPRPREGKEFEDLVAAVYATMTGRERQLTPTAPVLRRTPANTPLPPASVDGLSGLAEILAEILAKHTEPVDLAGLADELGLDTDDLFPLVDALELLGFATVDHHGVTLTDIGIEFAGADVQTSKAIFAATANRIPLVHTMLTSLQRTDDGTLRIGFFRDLLAHHYTSEQITQQLDVATGWGRYAELYSYNAIDEEYELDPAHRTTATERH
ncbi:nitrate/sulfonate/bicarbonate ABC transporter ATP-binding protein [Dactylosporangium sp. AC04546]|uniref:ABC transporter ATP-binding protein n=1 Tax=Dactylosporangium sp. AC04546 TaxID=2862460 RepID=UPI001EDDADDA|nr:nitrate/sulfonate/bicarbonate ABC transporter ATP-binding protein [Dactylosporangium sp. AC04546]WVK80825.1 nitrate/sulfonate/bicarbonate ABC transporter ATP-binding protein [Dactylosporangium sp. AC04546]